MRYNKIVKGRFVERPNRFIARVLVDGKVETVHVKNTGRCRELLVPDAVVYLNSSDNPKRKTPMDLVSVVKVCGGDSILINMDSQLPNDLVAEWLPTSGLFSEVAVFRREVTWGDSRFDFSVTDGDLNGFIEVKGVTLENGGVACFPDAPTQRGTKHLRELIRAREEGYFAAVVFVIQMKGVRLFTPNCLTDPDFAEALRVAKESGVRVLAVDCLVSEDRAVIDSEVPVSI